MILGWITTCSRKVIVAMKKHQRLNNLYIVLWNVQFTLFCLMSIMSYNEHWYFNLKFLIHFLLQETFISPIIFSCLEQQKKKECIFQINVLSLQRWSWCKLLCELNDDFYFWKGLALNHIFWTCVCVCVSWFGYLKRFICSATLQPFINATWHYFSILVWFLWWTHM